MHQYDQQTVNIHQDYIDSEGQMDSNSQTNRGNENNFVNKSKVISLGPSEKVKKDTQEEGKKMARKRNNSHQKNNNTKKEKKELPSSKPNPEKSLSSLSKKQVSQNGHIQHVRNDNEIKNEKNGHENKETDLDKIGNSELINARNIECNKKKNPKKFKTTKKAKPIFLLKI